MSIHLADYKPTEKEITSCEVKHDFMWLSLEGGTYKTCSKCGWFERAKSTREEKDEKRDS